MYRLLIHQFGIFVYEIFKIRNQTREEILLKSFQCEESGEISNKDCKKIKSEIIFGLIGTVSRGLEALWQNRKMRPFASGASRKLLATIPFR